MSDLEISFRATMQRYGIGPEVTSGLWDEIKDMHSTDRRHYHTLGHLEHIHQNLQRATDPIQDSDALVMATAYHDIIQNMLRKDDEERSAALMRERLGPLGFPNEKLERATRHILATRMHEPSDDPDTDLFTDADLAILGAPPSEYRRYAELIRKEYKIVPDIIYGPGRKKVLRQFLELPVIFKTRPFMPLEGSARSNIQWELERL